MNSQIVGGNMIIKHTIMLIVVSILLINCANQTLPNIKNKYNIYDIIISLKNNITIPIIQIDNNKLLFNKISGIENLYDDPTLIRAYKKDDKPVPVDYNSPSYAADIKNILSVNSYLRVDNPSSKVFLIGIIDVDPTSNYKLKDIKQARIGNIPSVLYNGNRPPVDGIIEFDFCSATYDIYKKFLDIYQPGTVIILDNDYLFSAFYKGNLIDQYVINPDNFDHNGIFDSFIESLGDYTSKMTNFSPRGFLEVKIGEKSCVNSGLQDIIETPVETFNGILSISLEWLSNRLGLSFGFGTWYNTEFETGRKNHLSRFTGVSRLLGNEVFYISMLKSDPKILIVSLTDKKTTLLKYKNEKYEVVKKEHFDLPFEPYIKNGQHMVPLLEICKQLGAEIHYRDFDKSILFAKFYKETLFQTEK